MIAENHHNCIVSSQSYDTIAYLSHQQIYVGTSMKKRYLTPHLHAIIPQAYTHSMR
jgi:hypothetical protein